MDQQVTASDTSSWAALRDQKYIRLTTFRKNGEGVPTTVWFAEHDGNIVVFTGVSSGKVKRIRNNPRVELTASTRRGVVQGPTLEGTARLLDGVASKRAEQAINRKYPAKWLLDLISRITRRRGSVVLEICSIAP